MANGKWQMANGKWQMDEYLGRILKFPLHFEPLGGVYWNLIHEWHELQLRRGSFPADVMWELSIDGRRVADFNALPLGWRTPERAKNSPEELLVKSLLKQNLSFESVGNHSFVACKEELRVRLQWTDNPFDPFDVYVDGRFMTTLFHLPKRWDIPFGQVS